MFFFLSKTLNFFTAPLVLICLAWVLSFFLRSPVWKKRLWRAGFVLLFFFCNDFIANEAIHRWELPPTPFADFHKKYQYGIILTGVTRSDYGPKDRVYFSRGADRVTHTLQLYKLGIIEKILISGGSGSLVAVDTREADDVASALRLMGVPDSAMVIENNSRNTHENAVMSIAILSKITKPENCLLVTSAYHMRRGRACFAKLDWHIDTFSTDFLSHERNYYLDTILIPHAEALMNWHIMFKEWLGYCAYKFAGYI